MARGARVPRTAVYVETVDFLATWNCTHLANACIISVLDEVNAQRGIRTPVVCTPEQLMRRPI